MKILPNFVGKSQFDQDIHKHFRPSACGPVTAYVIMNYLLEEKSPHSINELYKKLKGTKIGLFQWRFIRHLRKTLGSAWHIERCDIDEVRRQIDAGRPVAAKFDKWFRFRWFGHFSFAYHWVPIIGYKIIDHNLFLIVHDNGGKNRISQVRQVPYVPNKPILSFIKIEPINK